MSVANVQHAAGRSDTGLYADAADPAGMTVRIDEGLVMVFGPDGDPVPPAAFLAAARAVPGAMLRVQGGTEAPADRIAAVLEAQTRGGLAAPCADAAAWLEVMLGTGPAPVPMQAPDHADEDGHDLTIFGTELLIRNPEGQTAILGARSRPVHEHAVMIEGPGGQQLDQHRFVEILRNLARPGGASASGIPVPGCHLALADDAVVLRTPAGTRYRLRPADPDVAGDNLARLMSLDGETLSPAQAGQALGLRPEPLCERTDAPEHLTFGPEPAPSRPASGPPANTDLPGPRGVPSRLRLGEDGMLDLSVLRQAVAESEAPPEELVVSGLPSGVRLSAGRRDLDGTWRLRPADLGALTLFATPEGLQDFTLRVTGCDQSGALDHAFEVLVAPEGAASTLTISTPLSVPLNFPPPLSPRNDLNHYAVVVITGLPAGACLSAGAREAYDRWALVPGDLRNLLIQLPAGTHLPCTLAATGITIEDRDGFMSRTSVHLRLAADLIERRVPEPISRSFPLEIAAPFAGGDAGRRVRAVAVAGLPDGVELSTGAYDSPSACWILRGAELDGLRAIIRDPALTRLSFKATAVSIGPDGDERATSRMFDMPLVEPAPMVPADPGSASTSGHRHADQRRG